MSGSRSLFVALSILSAVGAAQKAAATDGPVDAKLLDAAAFAQWVDGKETPVSAEQAKDGPAAVVLTDGNHPKSLYGIRFGLGRATGPRHLRIGFTKSIPIGAVDRARGPDHAGPAVQPRAEPRRS